MRYRRGFFKQIEAVLADNMNKGRSLTMYSLDMDGLKIINDMYGHFEGDMAIMALVTMYAIVSAAATVIRTE